MTAHPRAFPPTSRRPGAWQPGRSRRRPPVRHDRRRDHPLRARRRRHARPRHGRLRDVGRARRRRRATRCSCATRSPATRTRRGRLGPGHPTPGWWDDLIGPGKRARHRPLLRRVLERARRLPGQHRSRRRSIPTTGRPYGLALPGRHRSATWSARRLASPTTSASSGG